MIYDPISVFLGHFRRFVKIGFGDCVDTSRAHLAYAIARPTWILLPFAPDWRWRLDCPDTPWYPSMRLFRPDKPRDWTSVIDQVQAALIGY
jgi:hypothetical protein